MEILRCNNLTKTYGQGSGAVTALDHVTLSLERGSFTAVVGASGSGKSTLLHILGGVDRPTKGNVYIEDTDISTLTPTESVYYHSQNSHLYPISSLRSGPAAKYTPYSPSTSTGADIPAPSE